MTTPASPGAYSWPGDTRPGDPVTLGAGDTDFATFLDLSTEAIGVSDTDSASFAETAQSVTTDIWSWLENPSSIGVSDTDAASFTDTGTAGAVSNVSSTDTASFSETQSVSSTGGGGAGPGFPLVFQMVAGPGSSTSNDSAHFTEAQSLVVFVSDTDSVTCTDSQNFPGGVPLPTALRVEGFSLTHVGLLMPGSDAESGTLYGAQSVAVTPQWITTLTQADDQVVSVWNAPGTVTLTVQSGFIPFDVLATMYNQVVSEIDDSAPPAGLQDQLGRFLQDQLGNYLLDQAGEVMGGRLGEMLGGPDDTSTTYYGLPLLLQRTPAPVSLVIRGTAKDAAGNLRVLQFVVYQAQFAPISFTGPAYKNGVVANWTASVMLSPVDEAGSPLPDRSYGRVMTMPAGATAWEPISAFTVTDSDSAHFTETAELVSTGSVFVFDVDSASFSQEHQAHTVGGQTFLSDTDSASFTDNQELSIAGGDTFVFDTDVASFTETLNQVSTGKTFITDTDSARFTESQRVSTGVLQVSDTDFARFSEAERVTHPGTQTTAGPVGATVLAGSYPSGALVTPCGTYQGATSILQSSNIFDCYAGRQAAHRVRLATYGPSVFPSSGSDPQNISALNAAGVKHVVVLQPNPALTQADQTALAGALRYFHSIGAMPNMIQGIALWPGPNADATFPNAAAYQAYIQHYGFIVRAFGYDLTYMPAMSSPDNVGNYYPGDTWCDQVLAIYYAKDYTVNGITLTNHDNVQALADSHSPNPIPFGLAAFGAAPDSTAIVNTSLVSWVNSQVTSLFSGRLTSGKYNGPLIWDARVTGAQDVFSASTPASLVTAFQSLFDQLNATQDYVSDTDTLTTRSRFAVIGSTSATNQYTGKPNLIDNANQFDTYVGRPMGISGCKLYYPTSFPTHFGTTESGLAASGATLVLCYKPNPDGSDAAALKASLNALSAASVGPVKCVLIQEPEVVRSNTPPDYFYKVQAAYRSAVKSTGVPLVYDASSSSGPSEVLSYFPVGPDGPLLDEFIMDYYCDSFISDQGNTITEAAKLADYWGIPVGFGELGSTAVPGTGVPPMSKQIPYFNFLQGFMLGRACSGLFNTFMAWYNGDPNTDSAGRNTILSNSDPRIPYLQSWFDTLSEPKVVGGLVTGGESPSARVLTNGAERGGLIGGRVAQLIGATSSPSNSCPVSVSNWVSNGNPTIGPLDFTRVAYTGAQTMDTWQNGHTGADNESALPAGAPALVTYTDSQISGLQQYAASIPDDRLVYLCYWPGAESAYPGGAFATFLAQFELCSQLIRSVGKANVKVAQISDSNPYGTPGSSAYMGSWVVPRQFLDAYLVDIYQDQGVTGTWSATGLTGDPRWLQWLSVFPDNTPLGISAYGLGATAGNAVRNTRLTADCTYLRSAFPPTALMSAQVSSKPLAMWLYWWSNCSGSTLNGTAGKYQFSDATTIATWQSIVAGSL